MNIAPVAKSPHPPFGHLLPFAKAQTGEGYSHKLQRMSLSPSPAPLGVGEGARRADEGSLVAANIILKLETS
jgi:hypothetical protein